MTETERRRPATSRPPRPALHAHPARHTRRVRRARHTHPAHHARDARDARHTRRARRDRHIPLCRASRAHLSTTPFKLPLGNGFPRAIWKVRSRQPPSAVASPPRPTPAQSGPTDPCPVRPHRPRPPPGAPPPCRHIRHVTHCRTRPRLHIPNCHQETVFLRFLVTIWNVKTRRAHMPKGSDAISLPFSERPRATVARLAAGRRVV